MTSLKSSHQSLSRTIRRSALGMTAGACVLLLAACGSDATVDNSDNSSTVPSVTTSTAKPSDAPTPVNPEDAQGNAGDNQANGGAAQDGNVNEVDQVPTQASRTPEDEKYLSMLKDKGVDVTKAEGSDKTGGLEDQVIAAGRAHCEAKKDNKPDIFLPVAAGQLTTMGVYQGEPQEAEKIMQDAATEAYCQ